MMQKAQSIRAKIALIARKEQVPFERIFTSFLLERAVARLVSHKELSQKLIFKGGFVSLREYNSSRFTKDVDAAIRDLSKDRIIVLVKEAMASFIDDGVTFLFLSHASIKGQTDYKGINFQYRAGLDDLAQNIEQGQIIDIDIGIGDVIIPAPRKSELKPILGEVYISWKVYSLETIMAEKIHSLIVLGEISSRSKDIFDMVTFLPLAETKVLKKAIKATFKRRKTALPDSIAMEIATLNTTILAKGWISAAGYIKDAEPFRDTFEKLISYLTEMGI